MAELSEPEQPHANIMYRSVRDETRRFPDYGAIDMSILTNAPPRPKPAEKGR